MMRLEDWRLKEGLSYENLAREFNFSTNKMYRICNDKTSIKLRDAAKIVKATNNEVDYPDLLVKDAIN